MQNVEFYLTNSNSRDTILNFIANYSLDHLCCIHGTHSKEKPGPEPGSHEIRFRIRSHESFFEESLTGDRC